MMLTSLVLSLAFVLTNQDCAPEQQDECGGPRSYLPFDDVLEGAAYYSRCTYPTDKLNFDCILSSCPSLSGSCPLTSNGSVDQPALVRTVTIINACIAQNCLICGINMTHHPMVNISWTTKKLLPENVINGTVSHNPGTGFLNNLSKAKFTAMDSCEGLITLSIRATNITNESNYNCSFDIAPASFLDPLKGLFPTLRSLNTPAMLGIYYLQVATEISIDLSKLSPLINILDDQSELSVDFSNFTNCDDSFLDETLVALPDYLVVVFNQGMDTFLKNSVITATAINFLSTFAALCLQVAQKDCP